MKPKRSHINIFCSFRLQIVSYVDFLYTLLNRQTFLDGRTLNLTEVIHIFTHALKMASPVEWCVLLLKSVLCWAQIFYHSLAAPLKASLVCTPLPPHLALKTPLD